ncbi:hypothetical protein DPMN_031221 [Dreissena polymorpha]|uniref:Uncharacterized protein n=1 Tax=Dreissena polymorpha TaxID=45954 RepID=A0A9D4M1T2_DREPO|nr:hypothetical protein DPMN_031221 [Dreissena polymorpha]
MNNFPMMAYVILSSTRIFERASCTALSRTLDLVLGAVTHAGPEDVVQEDKERVIKRYREQRKSDRENESSDAHSNEASTTDTVSKKRVRVSEDFPERVRKARSSLIPFLKESLEAGKNAYLRFDKLIVNGKSYVYDENKNRQVPSFI